MIYISSFPSKAWLLSILPYVSYLDFFRCILWSDERESATETFKWTLEVNKDLHQQRLRIDLKRFVSKSQSRISIRWIRVLTESTPNTRKENHRDRKTLTESRKWTSRRPELNTSLMPVAIRKICTKLIPFSDLNCIRKHSHKTEKIHFSHT